jgi:hypothetical protein
VKNHRLVLCQCFYADSSYSQCFEMHAVAAVYGFLQAVVNSQYFQMDSSYSQLFWSDSSFWQDCILFWSGVIVLFLLEWLASRHVARIHRTAPAIGKTGLIDQLIDWAYSVKPVSGFAAMGMPLWYFTIVKVFFWFWSKWIVAWFVCWWGGLQFFVVTGSCVFM